jgi:alpha-tubulin suppressor-like RCC1 family protein
LDDLASNIRQALTSGPYHTLAVTEFGEVYAFGMGLSGRLGVGHFEVGLGGAC